MVTSVRFTGHHVAFQGCEAITKLDADGLRPNNMLRGLWQTHKEARTVAYVRRRLGEPARDAS